MAERVCCVVSRMGSSKIWFGGKYGSRRVWKTRGRVQQFVASWRQATADRYVNELFVRSGPFPFQVWGLKRSGLESSFSTWVASAPASAVADSVADTVADSVADSVAGTVAVVSLARTADGRQWMAVVDDSNATPVLSSKVVLSRCCVWSRCLVLVGSLGSRRRIRMRIMRRRTRRRDGGIDGGIRGNVTGGGGKIRELVFRCK